MVDPYIGRDRANEPRGGLAPAPQYAEKDPNFFERKAAPNLPGNRGPLRFEEGVATDTDIPNDFIVGVQQGHVPAPGRPNHNMPVHTKTAQETLAQRAHVGSAAWLESPTFLEEFAHGSFNDYAETRFEQVNRYGGHYARRNPAEVPD